jgi:hypothetical protein
MSKYFNSILRSWPIGAACLAYGMIVSYLSITAAKQPEVLILDNSAYQNFALIVGASIGLITFLLSAMVYSIRDAQSDTGWNPFVSVLCIISGIFLGFASAFVVHISASNYGFIDSSLSSTIIDSSIAALFGGSGGFLVAMILQNM